MSSASAAPLSCVALEGVKWKCPWDLDQTLIFFIIVGCESSLHGGWNYWGNGKGRWLHQCDLNCWINDIKANGQWCLCRLSEGMSPAIAWSAVHTKRSSVKLMKSASVSKKLRWVYSGKQQNVKTEKKYLLLNYDGVNTILKGKHPVLGSWFLSVAELPFLYVSFLQKISAFLYSGLCGAGRSPSSNTGG